MSKLYKNAAHSSVTAYLFSQ